MIHRSHTRPAHISQNKAAQPPPQSLPLKKCRHQLCKIRWLKTLPPIRQGCLLAEHCTLLNISWICYTIEYQPSAQYSQQNITEQESSQQSSLPATINVLFPDCPSPRTPRSETPHTHTELVSKEDRCSRRFHSKPELISCCGSDALNSFQNKSFRSFTNSWLHLATKELIS